MSWMSSDGHWVVKLIHLTATRRQDGDWLQVTHHGLYIGKAHGWDGVARLGVDIGDLRECLGGLAGHGITTGALFRAVDRYNNIAGQPKYAGREAMRLTGKSVSDLVHRRAVLAKLPDAAGCTGHSLRSGAATSAYLAGAPVAGIAAHGRWSATSPVVLGYIRAVDKWRHNPMKGIGL
jgi:hypothetical protein